MLFHFQRPVKNINPKANEWAIDLVIDVIRTSNGIIQNIGSLGIEYDGHPLHYIESTIKKSYVRDLSILAYTDTPIVRFSQDGIKADKDESKGTNKKLDEKLDAIKRYVKNKILNYEKTRNNLFIEFRGIAPTSIPDKDPYIECPICKDKFNSGKIQCQFCSGYGKVRKSQMNGANIMDYAKVLCPACSSGSKSHQCRLCSGKEEIDILRAFEYLKQHPELDD